MEKDTTKMTIYEYNGISILVDDYAEVWMTQKQMAELLNITVQSVSDILAVAFKDGYLDEKSRFNRRLNRTDGKIYPIKHYSLRAILLVGFRSKSTKEAIDFQEWVTEIVRKHLSQHLEKEIIYLKEVIEGQQQVINTLRESAENNQNLLNHIQQLTFDANMQGVPKMLQAKVMEDHLKKLQDHKLDEAYQRKLKGSE